MTHFRKHFLTAVAALSLGAAAFSAHAQAQDGAPQAPAQAQPGDHPHADRMDHHGHQRRMPSPEQMAALRAKRVAKLHDELKITPAQEGAFKSFVAAMQPPAHAPQDQRQARAEWANLNAPQRMSKMIDLQKKRTAALEQRQGALNSFYAVLSPDQKKTFDERAARMQGRFGRHNDRGGMHDRMHGDWQQHGGTARG